MGTSQHDGHLSNYDVVSLDDLSIVLVFYIHLNISRISQVSHSALVRRRIYHLVVYLIRRLVHFNPVVLQVEIRVYVTFNTSVVLRHYNVVDVHVKKMVERVQVLLH